MKVFFEDFLTPIIGSIVISLIYVFLTVFFGWLIQKYKDRNKKIYSAWKKLTKNEKNLTLEEFITLKNGGLIK